MPAYLIQSEVASNGLAVSGTTVNRGATKPEGVPLSVVIEPSSAQYQGLLNYLGLIKAGVDTSTVQTAINALTP